MELMSQAMMSSRFLTMSVERLPEGLSCFVFMVDNCLCQWAKGILIKPYWRWGLFLPKLGDATSYLQLTKIQKIRSTVVWWVSADTISFITQRCKSDLTKSIQNSSAHILWETGLPRIYPNTPTCTRVKWQTGKVPLGNNLYNAYLEFLWARYCLSTFYRWVHFLVTLLGGKQVRLGAPLRDEEAEGHHEVKQLGQAFL